MEEEAVEAVEAVEDEVVEAVEDEAVEGGMVLYTIKPHTTQPTTTHSHSTIQDPLSHNNILGAPPGKVFLPPLVKLANV